MMNKTYIITTYAQDGEKMGWNNDYGWGDVKGAQTFTETDRSALNLPINGKWESFNHSGRPLNESS